MFYTALLCTNRLLSYEVQPRTVRALNFQREMKWGWMREEGRGEYRDQGRGLVGL